MTADLDDLRRVDWKLAWYPSFGSDFYVDRDGSCMSWLRNHDRF